MDGQDPGSQGCWDVPGVHPGPSHGSLASHWAGRRTDHEGPRVELGTKDGPAGEVVWKLLPSGRKPETSACGR